MLRTDELGEHHEGRGRGSPARGAPRGAGPRESREGRGWEGLGGLNCKPCEGRDSMPLQV